MTFPHEVVTRTRHYPRLTGIKLPSKVVCKSPLQNLLKKNKQTKTQEIAAWILYLLCLNPCFEELAWPLLVCRLCFSPIERRWMLMFNTCMLMCFSPADELLC